MSWSEARSKMALVFALCLGCGPTSSFEDGDTGSGTGEDGGGSSSGGSSSGASSGGSSSGSGGTGPGVTSETGDTWPDTTSATGGTSGGTPGDCPPSEGATAGWKVEGAATDPGPQGCTVTRAGLDAGGGFVIGLDCGGMVETTVTLFAAPEIDVVIEPEWAVDLDYIEDQPWWIEYYFTLRAGPDTGIYRPGDLIVAGMNATRPTPWGDEGFFRPFTVEAVPEGCLPVPDPVTGCGDEERVALAFLGQDGAWEVLDGSSARLEGEPPFRTNVERAVEYRDVTCDDFAESWYTALFAAQP